MSSFGRGPRGTRLGKLDESPIARYQRSVLPPPRPIPVASSPRPTAPLVTPARSAVPTQKPAVQLPQSTLRGTKPESPLARWQRKIVPSVSRGSTSVSARFAAAKQRFGISVASFAVRNVARVLGPNASASQQRAAIAATSAVVRVTAFAMVPAVAAAAVLGLQFMGVTAASAGVTVAGRVLYTVNSQVDALTTSISKSAPAHAAMHLSTIRKRNEAAEQPAEATAKEPDLREAHIVIAAHQKAERRKLQQQQTIAAQQQAEDAVDMCSA